MDWYTVLPSDIWFEIGKHINNIYELFHNFALTCKLFYQISNDPVVLQYWVNHRLQIPSSYYMPWRYYNEWYKICKLWNNFQYIGQITQTTNNQNILQLLPKYENNDKWGNALFSEDRYPRCGLCNTKLFRWGHTLVDYIDGIIICSKYCRTIRIKSDNPYIDYLKKSKYFNNNFIIKNYYNYIIETEISNETLQIIYLKLHSSCQSYKKDIKQYKEEKLQKQKELNNLLIEINKQLKEQGGTELPQMKTTYIRQLQYRYYKIKYQLDFLIKNRTITKNNTFYKEVIATLDILTNYALYPYENIIKSINANIWSTRKKLDVIKSYMKTLYYVLKRKGLTHCKASIKHSSKRQCKFHTDGIQSYCTLHTHLQKKSKQEKNRPVQLH